MCIDMIHVSFRRGSGSVKVEDVSYCMSLCFTKLKQISACRTQHSVVPQLTFISVFFFFLSADESLLIILMLKLILFFFFFF